jgi:hypothetical protein
LSGAPLRAELQLEVVREVPGRVVLAETDGTVHLGRNYDIHRSHDEGASWDRVASFPRSPWRRAAEVSRLACRLLRQEVRALVRLSDGTYVAANREGVFFGPGDGGVLHESEVPSGAHNLMPPFRMARGPADEVVWGEYGSWSEPRPIRLFASTDGGRHFENVHTFAPDDVLHIHNVCYDAGQDHYWVLAGDHGAHPGIGRLSSDFQRFEWLVRGEQDFRAVNIFDFGDRLVYPTDTEVAVNGVISLDKQTGEARRVCDIPGSGIYACRFGGLYAFSTTVEPSKINPATASGLWLSRDGETWQAAYWGEKDRWSPKYFQFGSVVLPCGESDSETLFFSGQAIRGLDGKTLVARLAQVAGAGESGGSDG